MADRRLHVGGQDFVVRSRPDEPGVHDFTWVSHPHDPQYGFSTARSDGSAMTEPEMRAAIADFLSDIDPETGYLAG
ncbi:hypothetical protein [Modestobacter sp. I12A-02662]|uniref:hypothetical protein n=1 Tax=Modestobacter sp. I12A-02662 TaxID=1730496 RepID=UPI0034E0134D